MKKKREARKDPAKNAVEIELTTSCNLGCYNCDRSTRQARSRENMSVRQVLFFMKESLRLGREWDYISLLGGEPALHPDLVKILGYFRRFGFNTNNLQVVTNGCGPKVKAALKRLPSWTLVNNTAKTSPFQKFRLYNLAPADFGVSRALPCSIPRICGHGLTRYGYYPCGAGASIDRVFGLGIGIRRLEDLTPAATGKQLRELCRLCGHSPSMNRFLPELRLWERKGVVRETEGMNRKPGAGYIAPMSQSWIRAYKEYRRKKPVLPLYGAV